MLRTLVYLLLSIFLITFVRAAVGLIGKAVAQLFQPSSPSDPRRGSPPASRKLRQCSACGVYTSEATVLRRHEGGKERFFCSEACREKFRG